MTIYGIKNCDTMQKALKYLDAKNIKYVFHNYKMEGLDEKTLEYWFNYLPLAKIINTKSSTYKKLSDQEKVAVLNKSEAMKLIIANTSMIKRPLFEFGEGKFLVGFNLDEWDLALNGFES